MPVENEGEYKSEGEAHTASEFEKLADKREEELNDARTQEHTELWALHELRSKTIQTEIVLSEAVAKWAEESQFDHALPEEFQSEFNEINDALDGLHERLASLRYKFDDRAPEDRKYRDLIDEEHRNARWQDTPAQKGETADDKS